jgi:hypothetical protein
MRLVDMRDESRFIDGLTAASDKKPTAKKASQTGTKAKPAAMPGAKMAPAPGANGAPIKKPVGSKGGKSPITTTHQKLHRIAQTHGFKHVGMSVYQHPMMNLTLSVGPQGWSLSDGTSGTDYEDLMTHLQKSFGLQMQDPNQVDPMTGQPVGMAGQPGAKKASGGGMGMQQPGMQQRQKNSNGFQASFLGQ